jgi:hypothetical protein
MLRPVALPSVLPYLVDAAIAKTALLAFNQCGANSLNLGGGFLIPKGRLAIFPAKFTGKIPPKRKGARAC